MTRNEEYDDTLTRCRRNSDIVQEIANGFGFTIHSFDPDWTLIKKITTISDDECKEVGLNTVSGNLVYIGDEFMGRLAIFLGHEWEFLDNEEKLDNMIDSNKQSISIYSEMIADFDKNNKLFNTLNDVAGIDIKPIQFDKCVNNRSMGNMIYLQDEIDIRKKLIAAGKGRRMMDLDISYFWDTPNSWRPIIGIDEKTYPIIIDSNGHRSGIKTHRISEDGIVTPFVVCDQGCGFHEYIKLVGWELITGDKQK